MAAIRIKSFQFIFHGRKNRSCCGSGRMPKWMHANDILMSATAHILPLLLLLFGAWFWITSIRTGTQWPCISGIPHAFPFPFELNGKNVQKFSSNFLLNPIKINWGRRSNERRSNWITHKFLFLFSSSPVNHFSPNTWRKSQCYSRCWCGNHLIFP